MIGKKQRNGVGILKKKIKAILSCGIIFLMPILMLLAAGGGAVGAVTEFFSDIGNAISSFFGGAEGAETSVTVDNVTAEELLAMVSNPDIITDRR